MAVVIVGGGVGCGTGPEFLGNGGRGLSLPCVGETGFGSDRGDEGRPGAGTEGGKLRYQFFMNQNVSANVQIGFGERVDIGWFDRGVSPPLLG